LSEIKENLKQFIDSRLREATRAQAIYPDRVYVESGHIRPLNSDDLHDCPESSSCDPDFKYLDVSGCQNNNVLVKKDFMW
jgi:hypothetical protein